MQDEFTGQVVIVTGGSQNIGLAIANAFSAAGATVICADLNPPAEYHDLEYIQTNVAKEESVISLMGYIEQKHGKLDVLVNNAGICIESPLQETTESDWDRVMAVNVKGVFLTTKHAFRLLQANQSGTSAIINISSIEGLGANPQHAAYGTSKGAVASLTHNTALEYGQYGIRCNAIAPGWINTPFNEKFLQQFPDRQKVDYEIKHLHPVGRLGVPRDIAETAIWLASPRSAFISGQEIIVDGGRLAKLPLPNL